MIESKNIISAMENKKKRWFKEESDGEVTRRIEVEEVENGFLITKTKSTESKELGYDYKCKKYISESNPFDASEDFLKSAEAAISNTFD